MTHTDSPVFRTEPAGRCTFPRWQWRGQWSTTPGDAAAISRCSVVVVFPVIVKQRLAAKWLLAFTALHLLASCPQCSHTSFLLQKYTPHSTALCPGLPGWAGTRKVKSIWILLKQETVSGSGISWVICKSAPRSRQITTPATHHSVFTGRMPFLPPNQHI